LLESNLKKLVEIEGAKLANIRAIVSCEGIPFGNSRNVFNQVIFSYPYASISIHCLAPLRTAQIPRDKISNS
jgi:hypothetical protein